ncbi:hypothetical protein Tco_1132048 [Tanacetum coccineum]|uniref:Uncharacterized protein n=1 Tax=Tanacetum coccineum TaxID=301880 RepID=A0ABQ5JAS1_9ASTR
MKKAFQDMLHELGEVNPTHAYYNGSYTSKDTENPSWNTSFKTRRTQKTTSALEVLWKTLSNYSQTAQTTIPNTISFQTEDLDAYDSDCDDVSNAKAVLMANLSNYGSDVISEEKSNKEKNNESLTTELERYKERVKTFEQRLNIDLSTREKMIDSQMDDMVKEKLALKQ